MQIYTKTGDNGETGFIGGRISKASDMIDATGVLDELNAVIGLVITEMANSRKSEVRQIRDFLQDIQSQIFSLGSLIVNPGLDISKAKVETNQITTWVEELEQSIDKWETHLQPLQNFILPGGDKAGAQLHHARTVCRRAERTLVRLISGLSNLPDSRSAYPTTLRSLQKYLNRLSDMMFVAARYINSIANKPEHIWTKDNKQIRMEFK